MEGDGNSLRYLQSLMNGMRWEFLHNFFLDYGFVPRGTIHFHMTRGQKQFLMSMGMTLHLTLQETFKVDYIRG
jgi:hypothetical protein